MELLDSVVVPVTSTSPSVEVLVAPFTSTSPSVGSPILESSVLAIKVDTPTAQAAPVTLSSPSLASVVAMNSPVADNGDTPTAPAAPVTLSSPVLESVPKTSSPPSMGAPVVGMWCQQHQLLHLLRPYSLRLNLRLVGQFQALRPRHHSEPRMVLLYSTSSPNSTISSVDECSGCRCGANSTISSIFSVHTFYARTFDKRDASNRFILIIF